MSEKELRALPNVGPAVARMLVRIGIDRPDELAGRDAEQLYERLWSVDGVRPDPCVLDTFVAIIDHADGAPAQPWWHYSRMRG